MGRIGLAAVGLSLLIAGGCKPDNRVELLQLDSVAVQELELNGRLRLSGSGFPTGRSCQVILSGHIHRPGIHRERFKLRLEGRALSTEQVEASLSSVDSKLWAKAGTFEGRITIAFPSRDGQLQVSGTSPQVRFALVQQNALGLKDKRARTAKALDLTAFIGIEVGDEYDSENGLVVKRVSPKSRADKAGLKPADLIFMQGSNSVRSLADLLPEPGASEIEMRVERSGESGPVTVRVALNGLSGPRLQAAQLQLLSLLVFALLCVALFSPAANALWRLLARFWATTGGVESGRFGTRRGRASRRGAATASTAFFLQSLAVGLILVATVFVTRALGSVFDPLVVLLSLFVLRISFVLFLSRTSDLRMRLQTALRCSRRMVLACAPVAFGCFLVESRSLGGLVAAQGALPWEWLVFKNPVLLLLIPLYLVACAGGLLSPVRSDQVQTVPMRWSESVYSALSCSIGAALFLGGWQSAGLPFGNAFDSAWVSGALFLLKASILLCAVRAMRALRWDESLGGWSMLSLLLGSALLTLLWRYAEVSAQLEAAIGYTLFITFIVVLLVATARVLAGGRKSAAVSPHPNPFL